MGGLVKGVKKIFKAVGGFVKKYWKVIVIAAAIYFTCGLAAGAMAPAAAVGTEGVAAGVEAGAGYAAVGTGVAAGATEGSMVGALGIGEGYLGAAAATETAAGFTAAGGVAAGVGLDAAMTAGGAAAEGAAAAGSIANAGDVSGMAEGGGFGGTVGDTGAEMGAVEAPDQAGFAAMEGTSSSAGGGATSLVGKGVEAAKGFWGGMSTGEKLMFASTAFNAISGALAEPTKASQGLWPGGAYFGMDEKGKGTDLAAVYKAGVTGADQKPATPPATAAAGQGAAPAPGAMQQSGSMSATGAMGPQQQTDPSSDTQANNLPTAAAGAAAGSDFLPAAGSGAANAQRANQTGSSNLASAQARNSKFFDDLKDKLDANRA